jgi:hypothetical protein
MVGATRGTPEGFRADQASGSQQPPPPPPNLAEVMARQTEFLNLLVQAQQNQQCQQSRGGHDDPHPQVANYQDFFSTQPPYLAKLRSPLMLMLGFAPLNPSFLFLRFHVRILIKLISLPNNYVVLPVFGGIIIMPCKLMAMLSPGKNFRMLSEHIIYPKD